jgi:glycine hydroxymethyltransferase
MKESEMKIIADMIDRVLSNIDDDEIMAKVREEVKELNKSFQIYRL